MAILRNIGNDDQSLALQGKEVYLRQPVPNDYTEWVSLREESRDFLTPWEPIWPVDDLTRPSFRRRIKRYQRDLKEDAAYPFFVFRKNDDTLLGSCIMSNVRRGVTQACSMGYWVGERFHSKGYMTDAVRAILPYMFETVHMHRIEAACLANNDPSQRLLKRVGFHQEGYARKYLKISGEWQDHLLFAMLDTDPRT